MSENEQQLIGQYIGKFKIDSYIGEEPYAQIYRGHHESLDRLGIIKILLPSTSAEYFLSHCQMLVSLEHETIASIYDIAFDNELQQYYVVEQAVEGQTLDQLLEEQNNFSIQEALKIILEISHAIAFAHHHGVVHGNISPANLVRTKQQSWKIVNFALVPTQVYNNITIFGVPGYIAPEMMEGSLPNITTDIYQLGAIFCELLTNAPPCFEEPSPSLVMQDQPTAEESHVTNPAFSKSPIMPTTTKESHRITRRMQLRHDATRRFIGLGEDAYPTKRRTKNEVAGTTPNAPRLALPRAIPDAIADCMGMMLAYNPNQRFHSVTEVVSALEYLWITFNQVICPHCGKQNSISEVFHCSKCNTSNLCLKHMVPEHQCCDRCAAGTQHHGTRRVIASDNWRKLEDLLRNIANNNRFGMLVLGPKGGEIGIHIMSNALELYSNLPMPEYLVLMPADSERAQKIFDHYLLHFMQTMECQFDFWENDGPDKILPNVILRSRLSLSPGGFFITFSQILRVFRDLCSHGAIYFTSMQRTLGLAITEYGATFGIFNAAEQKWEIHNEPESVEMLVQLFEANIPVQIEYRVQHPLISPPHLSLPFSTNEFSQVLREGKSWTKLGNLLPEIHVLFPPTVRWDRPFGGIELSELNNTVIKNLFSILNPHTVQEATGFTLLKSLLFMAAMMKERIVEITQQLIATVQLHPEINVVHAETILLSARQFYPESLELCYALAQLYEKNQEFIKAAACYSAAGALHLAKKDIGLALPDYEKAVTLDQKPIEPRLRLMDLYEQLEQREKLRKVGLDLFITLQQNPQAQQSLEDICKKLLKADNGLVPCHQAMIKIAIARKDNVLAQHHYDILIQLYHRASNRQGMVNAIKALIQLTGKEIDVKRKIESLGYNWQELFQSSKIQYLRYFVRLSIVLLIMLGISYLLYYREQLALEQLAKYKEFTVTLDNLPAIKTQLWEMSETRYFSPEIYTQINNLLAQYYEQEKNLRLLHEAKKEERLFNNFLEAVAFCKKTERWKDLCALDENALLLFQKAEHQQEIRRLQVEHEKKLQEWIKANNIRSQRNIAKAREYERRQEYWHAVELYFNTAKDPILSLTPATQNITIPLLVELPIDSFLTCWDETQQKRITRTTKIYRYPIDKIPSIKARHPSKTPTVVSHRTVSGHVWKVVVTLK